MELDVEIPPDHGPEGVVIPWSHEVEDGPVLTHGGSKFVHLDPVEGFFFCIVEGDEAVEIAKKLKQIIVAKGLKIDFNKIPVDSMFVDSSQVLNKNRYIVFPAQLPNVYLEKIGKNWYYSPETTSKINEIWSDVFPWYTEQLLQIIPEFGHKSFLGVELWQYVGFIFLLICSTILFYILRKLVYFILRKIQYWVVHYKNQDVNIALKKLTRPIVFLLLMDFVIRVLPSLFLPLEVNNVLFLVLNIIQLAVYVLLQCLSSQQLIFVYQLKHSCLAYYHLLLHSIL